MKIIREEKYREQPDLKVFRIAIEEKDDKKLLRRLYETRYDELRDMILKVVPKIFEKQRVIIESSELENGELSYVTVNVWKQDGEDS